ncbi:Qnr family pentapeptide repeat protein [Photobacterium leiognathi]|uniref:Qnr family pentapeptide repeat protein n=1 Tax=Photobacterium leiognathi TaxID=553611 RepID=UPI000D160075|nr:Qnr family pentapeptide repeat protein [Photobacterium leiognathi]PSW56272.1 Qnr family pentapeptide repeat protein [Photobacterium leiognathi subsp. mandapamensis]
MHVVGKCYQSEYFSGQDLSEAIFENCQFYRCDFSRANLLEASFVGCSFIEAGDEQGANFSYAKLKDASFKNCNLSMANFRYAQCFGIEMRGSNLQGADFQYASFSNYITQNTFFSSAYITGCNLRYSNFEDVKLEQCELFENRWNGANLLATSLKGSDLSRGEFSSEHWQQCMFEGADLCHVDLEGVDIRRVNLQGVKICDWQQEQLLSQLGIIVL